VKKKKGGVQKKGKKNDHGPVYQNEIRRTEAEKVGGYERTRLQ